MLERECIMHEIGLWSTEQKRAHQFGMSTISSACTLLCLCGCLLGDTNKHILYRGVLCCTARGFGEVKICKRKELSSPFFTHLPLFPRQPQSNETLLERSLNVLSRTPTHSRTCKGHARKHLYTLPHTNTYSHTHM